MYRQYEKIEVCMYNICSTNHFVREFTTSWFSQTNFFHDRLIYEYTGKKLERKVVSKNTS